MSAVNAGLRSVRWVPLSSRKSTSPHHRGLEPQSFWIESGANPKKIASYAGHESTRITFDRYGHLFPDGEDGVRAALDEQFHSASRAMSAAPADGEDATSA